MPVPPDLQASGQPLLVLVADAEASFREDVGRRLSGRVPGAIVEEAASGVQALVKVGQMRPALVILDLELSDVNASEVCRQLEDAYGLEHTSVLAVTRKPAEVLPAGAAAVVQRSLGTEAVVAAAAHALQNAGASVAPD